MPASGGKKSFVHSVALAQDPKRGYRGPGAQRKINSIPQDLHEEILQHCLAHRSHPKGQVVLDLCAGFESLRPVVEGMGLQYCAVDIKNRSTQV